jgi:anti-anti-sigma factor
MRAVTEGTTLVLQGQFDVRSTAMVRDRLYELIEAHDGDIVVDVSGLELIDATALNLVAVATRMMDRSGRRLVLRGSTPAVRRCIALTRIGRLVQLDRTPISV